MRVLFVSPFLPYPPVAGGHAQIWSWMTHLATWHELAFVGFYEREAEAENVPTVAELCAETRARLRKPTPHAYSSFAQIPASVSEYASRELAADLREACGSFRPEVVQFLSMPMAQYAGAVGSAATVVTALEIGTLALARRIPVTSGFARWQVRLERLRTLRYEAHAFARAAGVVTMSESDSRTARRLVPGATVTAVPPGVEAEAFAPRARRPEPGAVLYVGHMEHYPNVDGLLFLYREVWPLVRRGFSQAHLTVAGYGTREELARVAPEVLGAMEADASVELAGFVPDLKGLMDRQAVMVAPLRLGGGVRNKVIEAMAAGLPVVTTRVGAEGLAVQPDREVLIADEPAAFAEGVVRVLGDADLQQRLGEAGRRLVARDHDNRALARRLEGALVRALGERG